MLAACPYLRTRARTANVYGRATRGQRHSSRKVRTRVSANRFPLRYDDEKNVLPAQRSRPKTLHTLVEKPTRPFLVRETNAGRSYDYLSHDQDTGF
jgi:hypothetical protein